MNIHLLLCNCIFQHMIHSYKLKINTFFKKKGEDTGLWKLPCNFAILNTVAEMDIAVLPYHSLWPASYVGCVISYF